MNYPVFFAFLAYPSLTWNFRMLIKIIVIRSV